MGNVMLSIHVDYRHTWTLLSILCIIHCMRKGLEIGPSSICFKATTTKMTIYRIEASSLEFKTDRKSIQFSENLCGISANSYCYDYKNHVQWKLSSDDTDVVY